MKSFCKILIVTALFGVVVACHRDEPASVVKSFYYAYQNLDFEKAREYCTPYMSQKISLIEEGFNEEKQAFLHPKIKKQHISVGDVSYNDAGNQAVVTVVFTAPEDTVHHIDYVTLEKCGEEWKVSNF